jgi:hypothetical protein
MAQPNIVLAQDLTASGIPIVGVSHKFDATFSVEDVLTPLYTYTIPANGFANDGDALEFWIYGTVAPGIDEQLVATVAGVAIIDTGVVDTLDGKYILHGFIVRVDAETVNVAAALTFDLGTTVAGDSGFGFDCAVPNDFVVSGLGPTDNDVSVKLAIVNFRGKP